jgi:hypothetical protein
MTKKEKQEDSVNERDIEAYQLTQRSSVSRILEMARNLSTSERNLLQKELEIMEKEPVNPTLGDFSSFLLTGPLMSTIQLEEFNTQRETFNKWRIK